MQYIWFYFIHIEKKIEISFKFTIYSVATTTIIGIIPNRTSYLVYKIINALNLNKPNAKQEREKKYVSYFNNTNIESKMKWKRGVPRIQSIQINIISIYLFSFHSIFHFVKIKLVALQRKTNISKIDKTRKQNQPK